MHIRHQRQNHSGQEVHSMVHLCPKCGWPYSNPHPSAKHRRSHNRVCGTIEGYRSAVDSGSRTNLPEDDHDHDHEHSDEEHHAPSTVLKVLESSLNDGGSKEISERSYGSKEEAFLNAATHFSDGSPTPLVEASSFAVSETVGDDNKNLVVDLIGLQAHEDRTTEIGQKPSDSSDSSMQNFLGPKNGSQELSGPEVKELSTGSAEQGEAKFVETPNDLLNQSNGVAAARSFCVGSETLMNSSAKADVSIDSEMVNEQSADDLINEGDIIAKEQARLISSLPSKDADVVSAVVPSEGFSSMEEGCIDAASTAHQSETPDSVSSGIFSAENLKKEKNFHMYVVPKDIPVIEHPERLIEGYKDYSAPKLHLPKDMDLPDTILQKEDSFVPVSLDSSLSEMKVQKEVGDVSSSDCILPKDKSEPDDNLKELKEDVQILPEVVVCEKTLATNESRGDNACKSEKLEAKEIDQHLSTVDLPIESFISAFHEIEATEISNNTSENNLSESDEKHCPIAPELLVQQNEVQDKSVTNLIEVERASDAEKPESEWVVPEIETREGNFEGNDNLKVTAAESAVSASAVESTLFDGVSGNDTANVTKDVECSEDKGELSVIDAENNSESTIKYQVHKEAGHVQAIDAISSGRSYVTVENNQSRDPSVTTAKIPIGDEGVDNFVIAGPDVVSAPESSIDLNSQTDSLEVNWGSISVLSTQSDPSIATESELLTPAHEVASIEAGESIMEAEEKGSEKTNAFEAPSFITLVEHGVGANQTGGVLAQQEDKKNSEIISNQGAGKHHSPLKNLLVEATQEESKLKSSSQKESFASVQKDETGAVATMGKILAADDRKSGGSVKEWDSPARYPADIKQEKRKVKGHWMPFICCSSAN